jgi:hypothetical protein
MLDVGRWVSSVTRQDGPTIIISDASIVLAFGFLFTTLCRFLTTHALSCRDVASHDFDGARAHRGWVFVDVGTCVLDITTASTIYENMHLGVLLSVANVLEVLILFAHVNVETRLYHMVSFQLAHTASCRTICADSLIAESLHPSLYIVSGDCALYAVRLQLPCLLKRKAPSLLTPRRAISLPFSTPTSSISSVLSARHRSSCIPPLSAPQTAPCYPIVSSNPPTSHISKRTGSSSACTARDARSSCSEWARRA